MIPFDILNSTKLGAVRSKIHVSSGEGQELNPGLLGEKYRRPTSVPLTTFLFVKTVECIVFYLIIQFILSLV